MPTKTYSAKPGEVERGWYVVDANGETLGRLATRIADTLRGKRKPQYTPHIDTGDFVVVVNCERIRVTGKKLDDKIYYRHSGYHGGLKERTLARDARAAARGGHPPRGAGHDPAQPPRAAPSSASSRSMPGPSTRTRRSAQAARREEVVMAENDAIYRGTGKRKTSVARVILTPGSGAFTVNGRALDEYFGRPTLRTTATSPLELTGSARPLRRARLCDGGGDHRPGRRAAPRHRPRADRGRPELRVRAQARRAS